MVKYTPNDKVYTPEFIVDEVLAVFGRHIKYGQTLLEPFKGGGAFYDKLLNLSDDVLWCEIDEGVDFFEFTPWRKNEVDWIITKPPYSIFKEVLPKMLDIADNIVLVIPVNKLLSSMPRLMQIERAGCNIKQIHYLGSGRQLGFPFGFPVGAVYIQRGWEGDVEVTYAGRCWGGKGKK